MRQILIYILFAFLFQSCSSELSSEKELYAYISAEENGLVKKRDHGDVEFKVKYLPEEYLVYKELKDQETYTEKDVDSLKTYFHQTRTFLVTIGFKESGPGENVLMYGAKKYKDYAQRIDKLNFSLDEYIRLITPSGGEIRPVLWTLENTYTAGNRRTLYVVFPREEKEEPLKDGDLVFMFDDEIFYTGPSRFLFDIAQLDKIPALNFWKFDPSES